MSYSTLTLEVADGPARIDLARPALRNRIDAEFCSDLRTPWPLLQGHAMKWIAVMMLSGVFAAVSIESIAQAKAAACCSVFELRQYTLKSGQRENVELSWTSMDVHGRLRMAPRASRECCC